MADRSSIYWLFQAVTGIMTLVLGAIHLLRNHLSGSLSGLLTRKEVLTLIRRPGVALLEAIFMVAISYHAVYGVRGILMDLGMLRGKEKVANKVFAAIAVIMIAYGLGILFYLLLTPS